jgi:hypothetical protein
MDITIEDVYNVYNPDEVANWEIFSEYGDEIGLVTRSGMQFRGEDDELFNTLSEAAHSIGNAYSNRVRAGAILLDEHRPEWFKGIDTEKLNMSMYTTCIIGQLFKIEYRDFCDTAPMPWTQFVNALNTLGIESEQESRSYGFTEDDVDSNWRTLKGLWLAEIEWRKSL